MITVIIIWAICVIWFGCGILAHEMTVKRWSRRLGIPGIQIRKDSVLLYIDTVAGPLSLIDELLRRRNETKTGNSSKRINSEHHNR